MMPMVGTPPPRGLLKDAAYSDKGTTLSRRGAVPKPTAAAVLHTFFFVFKMMRCNIDGRTGQQTRQGNNDSKLTDEEPGGGNAHK